MRKQKFVKKVLTGLVIWMVCSANASALQIEFDLTEGIDFGGLYFAVIPLQESISLANGESDEIWIDFFNANNGAKQHLEVFASSFPMDDTTLGLRFDGPSGSQAGTELDVIATFTGVMGDLNINDLSGGCLVEMSGTCFTGRLPISGSGSLTDTNFLFHDIHIDITVADLMGSSPVTVNQVAFLVGSNIGGDIEIGEWPIPEPTTLALFGIGMVFVANKTRRI